MRNKNQGLFGCSDEQDISGWAAGEVLTLNVTADVVPKPATLPLLAAAALGLAGCAWRRRSLARTAKPAACDRQDPPAILSFPSHSSPAGAARRAA